MYTVTAMAFRSPMLMAELRRLHVFLYKAGVQLQMHHPPSALNLYADRLSRRIRLFDCSRCLSNVPEHLWTGDSEHDSKLSLGAVRLLRPPLEMLPLVREKINGDGFQGRVLVPDWPSQKWLSTLRSRAPCQWRILPSPFPPEDHVASPLAMPEPPSRPRPWPALFLVFSQQAVTKSRLLTASRPFSVNASPGISS